MRILVVGSGGRGHALVWKLSQSPEITKLFCAPGNGGIGELAELVDIGAEDIDALTEFAESRDIDLTIVGPEATLAKGIGDAFEKRGLRIFGPIMEDSIFRQSGEGVVIEERVIGEVASFIVVADGTTALPPLPAQDHKRLQ